MRTDRRGFLRVVGMGAAGALAGPAATWADRIRILPGEAPVDRPVVGGRVSPDFQRFLAGIRVGQAAASGGLLVLWFLSKEGGAPLPVATLEEGRGRGELAITERDQASVPELIVENGGESYVLLLAGEILLGGKQNRVLREDILLPPLSGPRNIGVYCVEQGRWAGRTKDFEAKGTFAAPALRSRLMEKADQGRVWAEVDKAARSAAAPSATMSYQEVYEKKEVKDHLQAAEAAIDRRAAPWAVGAAVFAADALLGLDLFLDAGLFAREWPKLLRAYALETYGRTGRAAPNEKRARAQADTFLSVTARAEGTLRSNAGVGQIFEFRIPSLHGSALMFDGWIFHAAIL